MFLGVGQSQTPATLTGSISTRPSRKDEPEILYHGLPECALLGFEVEPMSAEDVQHPYHNGMVFLLHLATENEDVIHHHLECLQAVSETKEHGKRF